MEKIQFVLLHYAEISIFAASCFGFGIWVTRLDKSFAAFDRIFNAALATCIGIGIFIVGMQALGIAGLINEVSVAALLLAGLTCLSAHLLLRPAPAAQDRAADLPEAPKRRTHWLFPCLLALIVSDLLLMPLHPPADWDELMYHLPHASEWASRGSLSINEGRRYPLFPYNFNLLYAAGLTYGNEIFAHMANSLAGWLSAIGLYRLAAIYFNRAVASIAALLFVCLCLGQFAGAMADLGVTLFLFFGFACVFLWQEKKNFSFLCVALFLIGVAAGIKYQALIYLPLLAVVILLRERRPLRLLGLLALFLLPCLYWYLRNYLVAGDPFNPMGGKLFGYWSWNAEDMALQLADIKRVADWPRPYVWPALGALFLRSKFSYAPFRATLVFAVYAFAVWMFTSHYSRYLMPAFPAIALLTAIVFNHLYVRVTGGDAATAAPAAKPKIHAYARNTLAALLLAALGSAVVKSVSSDWNTIAATPEARAEFLKARIKSFEIGEFLKQHPEYQVVQIDLESELYYLPPNTIGDVFGPGRYRQFDRLPALELANKLKAFNANAMLFSTVEKQSKRMMEAKDFLDRFVLIKETPGAKLYGIRQVPTN